MFLRLSLLTLLAIAGLQAKFDPKAQHTGEFSFSVDEERFAHQIFPSNSVDLNKKTINNIDGILTGPLGIFPLGWGGMVAKNAKTWKQVVKHTAAAAVYAAFFAALQAAKQPGNRVSAARLETEAVARLYFSGMFTTYFQSALYNYIDKGELPVWMGKSLAKAKAYRKAHPAAQEPDSAA